MYPITYNPFFLSSTKTKRLQTMNRFNAVFYLLVVLLPSSGVEGFSPLSRTPVNISPIKTILAPSQIRTPSTASITYPRDLLLTIPATTSPADDASTKSLGKKIFDGYVYTANIATNLFPLWTVLFSGLALKSPQSFDWFTTEYFTAALAALMLSMGITLTPEDFVRVAQNPSTTTVQFLLCYGMMPFLALGLGKTMGLSKALIAGLVLVGCTNGGQASNLCTYIARGDVALSVLMTTVTTLGAIVMTPLLCKTILGTVVPVDAAGIAKSTIEVVLVPIVVGMTANKFFPKIVEAILPFAPVVGVASTCLLVASAVAQVSEPILAAGWTLQIACLTLHLLGGLVGYFLPKVAGYGEVNSRTMAIETAMKSSAFAFLLAKLHFGDYAARVPAAVSVVWMALTGSILAVVWRFIPVKGDGKGTRK